MKRLVALGFFVLAILLIVSLVSHRQMRNDILHHQGQILSELDDVKRLESILFGMDREWEVAESIPVDGYEYVDGEDGGIAGVAKRTDTTGESAVYPVPVYGMNGRRVQIGWLAAGGFYPLSGVKTPDCPACPIVVEKEVDGVRHRMTIRGESVITGTVRGRGNGK